MSMPVDEQRVLERISDQLAAEDAALHATFRRFTAAHADFRWPRPAARAAVPARRPRWVPVAVVVGLALAVAGVVARRPEVAFGGALLAACAPWLVAPAGAPRHRRPTV